MSADEGFGLVVVANRLPVERADTPQGWVRAPGGLVTALTTVVRRTEGAWVGWDGSIDGGSSPFTAAGMHLVPVPMSQAEVTDFYDGFANATLWPLFHDVIVKPQYHRQTWAAYRAVNERFAAQAAAVAAPGATVWVHDYQLTLVPGLLRARRPDLTIGFFNHIPFPPYEIFAQLPWGSVVVAGLLGADLLGFQRPQDASNFLRACRRSLGARTSGHGLDRVDPDGRRRRIRVRAYPIGVDAPGLEAQVRQESTSRRVAEFREQLGDRRIILGVDRLDYTKGISVRLRAMDELFAEGRLDPDDVVFVQVATPTRERVDAYREMRDAIELAVGRVNGRYATLSSAPIVYLHSTMGLPDLLALYRIADVMLVTPLRDGMNLVAKEYVACRIDDSGVLVLSRFTGAADTLTKALLVNPHDIEGVKDAIIQAVGMPLREQRARMRALRREVRIHDVQSWAEGFLADLAASPS